MVRGNGRVMAQASTVIAAVLLLAWVAAFPTHAVAQTGAPAPSRPPPTQTCKACVLDLGACLRRCTDQHHATPDRLTCVNACTATKRCARGVTCIPDTP
jgi:hypothetical protein